MNHRPTAPRLPLRAACRRRTCTWLAFLLPPALFAAQAVRLESPSDAARPDEEIVLSPFEVSTSKDVGFVASSSLAGGRLAGDLKDTPAAYSVLTREFIDALGIVDLSSASDWTVNSTNALTNGNDEIWGSTTQLNARGVSASAPQRNFFELPVNYDSYNLDRFDYSRGPNAILFGSGTFGGAANVVTKVARTDRAFATLRTSYGSWDNLRATLDVNRPISSKAAVRANLLWQDAGGWRDYQMEKKKAFTLANFWRPLPNTEVRAEVEAALILKNNPITTRVDRFLGWDGATVNNQRVFVPVGTTGAAGLERLGSATSPYPIFSPGSGIDGIINYAQTARTLGATQSGSKAGGMSVNGALTLAGNPFTDARNLPDNIFDLTRANSNFELPSRSQANSTDVPTMKQHYVTYSAFLRQKFGSDFFAEIAGNYGNERRQTQYMNTRNMSNMYIDVNTLLPTGAPNPHFLDTFSDGQRSRGYLRSEVKNLRAAAAYSLDLDRWGSYVFNTYGGLTRSENTQLIQTLRVLRLSDPRQWAFNDMVYYRYYTNDHNRPLREFDSATYTDPATNVATNYRAAWITDGTRATDASITDRDHRYVQAAVKGVYWKKRIHLLGAVRYDNLSIDRLTNMNYGDYPMDWDGSTIYYRPAAPADYLSLPSYVPKDAAGKPTGSPQFADRRPRDSSRNPLPQYANDRFQDDFNPPVTKSTSSTKTVGGVYHVTPWASVFANYATGFAPASGNLYLDGTLLPSAKSDGTGYGLKFFLLNNRVSLNIERYEGFETPQSVELNGSRNQDINAIANANAKGDQSSEGRNRRGFDNVPTQTFDTRDRSTRGYEVELTANLTSDWRLSFNVALPKAYQENAYNNTRQFLAANEAVMRQILADAGVLIDPTTDVASLDSSITDPEARSPDASAARDAWNNLRNFRRTLATGRQKIVRLSDYTMNFYTDYRFRNGPLKDVSIGGGANFRGKEVIGYRASDTMLDPANPTRAIDDPNLDEYTPVYNSSYYLVTATLGYRQKLAKGRTLEWQLRVSNLFNEMRPRYYDSIMRPPNGDFTTPVRVSTPNNYYYLTPRSFLLSTTLSF